MGLYSKEQIMIKASAFKSHDVILSVLERPCSCVTFRVTCFLLSCFLQHFFVSISLFILHDNFLIFSSTSILFNSEGIYQEFSISRFLDIVETDNLCICIFFTKLETFQLCFSNFFLLRFPFYPLSSSFLSMHTYLRWLYLHSASLQPISVMMHADDFLGYSEITPSKGGR